MAGPTMEATSLKHEHRGRALLFCKPDGCSLLPSQKRHHHRLAQARFLPATVKARSGEQGTQAPQELLIVIY